MILTSECNASNVNNELKRLQNEGCKIIDIKYTTLSSECDTFCLIIYDDGR